MLNQEQRRLRIGSTLDGFDQSYFASAHNHDVHDVHARIDNSPRDIGTNRSQQKLTNPFFSISNCETGGECDGQHHNQAKQDLAQSAGRIEVALGETAHSLYRSACGAFIPGIFQDRFFQSDRIFGITTPHSLSLFFSNAAQSFLMESAYASQQSPSSFFLSIRSS